MATVRGVVNFKVKPGRYADLFEGIKAVKKNIVRLGATLVVSRQAIGPEAGNILVVIVYQDYAAYAKAASDSELQGLIDQMRGNPNPAWEGLTVSLNEEVTI
ncbi:MAG: hypothetical protein ACLQBA_18980 [Candidatus Binataceae bacterium]